MYALYVDALVRIYRHLFAILAQALKGNDPLDQGKQCVIPTATHVVAGMDLRTALTVDNVAGLDSFAAEFFTAKPLPA